MSKKLSRVVVRSVRLTAQEDGELKVMAEMYEAGDVSKFIRHCIKNFERKMLRKNKKKDR